mgnify:CR=1 FL=1
MLKMIEERPWLWATHVWNLFDFAADGRDEGGKHGENQKGLVTIDRRLKRMRFIYIRQLGIRKNLCAFVWKTVCRSCRRDDRGKSIFQSAGSDVVCGWK